ncbi:TonB-dependent receptor [Novosphingobium colocasiae]|uniref:TonB-dependent receptor n=1 Tax=Novosphingobium colocasiae TaxID=1256513 RepID=A0A918P9D3_9SPHN|nr:TonB-dependent receptor [Novosphingobium colocasiae]GGY90381.1 TonB-dependent receptor [Novosphingobium colocasiae]
MRKYWKAALLAACAMPQVVQAQENAAETAEAGGDIIVTAQRRSERLQDIPASISALDSAMLTQSGVADISNVAPRVPGFYAGGFGSARPQLYIRGIGTRQFDPGSESSVGVFVDESYLGRTGGVLGSLKDIERVEVLKGPQGTLYGRNTIAGAVNVITKGPTDTFSAEAEAGYGNYDAWNVFGAVSGPIAGDVVKGRIAGWRTKARGYVTNLTTGNHPQGTDNWGGRARLAIEPSSELKIDLIAEIARDTGRSFQGESIGSTLNPNGILLGKAGLVPEKSDDPYKQYYTTDPEYNRHIDAFTGKLNYSTDLGDFVSVTSYRKLKYTDDRDFDNTNLDVIQQISAERSKQFSQEFRFVSANDGALSFNGAVDWILGVYYYKDTSYHQDNFLFGADSVAAGGDDLTFGHYKTKSVAVFGQSTFHFTDQLTFTLGARYTEDRKKATLGGRTNDALPLVRANFDVTNPTKKFTSFDPKFVLSYQPTRDLNLYVSWSKGFKSGGYQYTPLTAAQAGLVFNPETIRAWEAGVKSTWLDGTLRANAAVFQYDYKNLQVSRVVLLPDGSTPSLIDNAGKSKIKGAELDLTIQPVRGFDVTVAYAYTDAKYDEYLTGPKGAASTLDFSDTRMVRAPKHSVNVGATYTVETGSNSDLTFHADASMLSDFFHEPGQGDIKYGSTIPLTSEDGYVLSNARITYRMGDFKIAGWIQNAFDVTYRRTVLALPGQVISIYGQPRTYGATIGWSM